MTLKGLGELSIPFQKGFKCAFLRVIDGHRPAEVNILPEIGEGFVGNHAIHLENKIGDISNGFVVIYSWLASGIELLWKVTPSDETRVTTFE